nr:hypothetical protein [Suaeda aralocaspica]
MLGMWCPSLGWDYSSSTIELDTSHHEIDNLDFFESVFVAANNIDSSSNQTTQDDYEKSSSKLDINVKQRSESPQGTSSTDDDDNPAVVLLAKKLNHNASERDRRKKINTMYSSLRSLLPAASSDHRPRVI